MSIFRKIKKSFLLIPAFIFLIIFFAWKNENPIFIPVTTPQQSADWKIYKNTEYGFSFKYPDVELSNFQISKEGISSSTYNQMLIQDKSHKPNYNVIFEAGASKTSEKIDDFIDSQLPETNSQKKLTVSLGHNSGRRITNIDTKSNAYYQYNIFKNKNFIYKFALISDDPVLISANQNLLDEIIGTVEFY